MKSLDEAVCFLFFLMGAQRERQREDKTERERERGRSSRELQQNKCSTCIGERGRERKIVRT